MGAVRVVEPGVAHTDLHVGHARAACRAVDQRPVLRANGDKAGVAGRVTEEVGRQLLVVIRCGGLAERGEGAMKLGGHGVEEDGGGLLRRAAAVRTNSGATVSGGTRSRRQIVRHRGIAEDLSGVRLERFG